MKRFLIKGLFFLFPLATILVSYFILDPFKVLRRYSDYSANWSATLDRDYISTEVYLKNRQTYHYDSFIFGSSRTDAFRTADWRQYLPKNASPFVFGAFCETIDGIHAKINLIDELNDPIENALIVLDTDGTFQDLPLGHLYVKHPRLTKEPLVLFHTVFIKTYFSNFFFLRYLDYRLFKTYRPYMEKYLVNFPFKIDTITNDFFLIDQEKEQEINPLDYYRKKKKIFYARDATVIQQATRRISYNYIILLKKINSIFQKRHTRYKIIISPLYDQKSIHPYDLHVLYRIFGKQNVFDFSGINQYTNDITNYYETSHYTAKVGKNILKTIYAKSGSDNNQE